MSNPSQVTVEPEHIIYAIGSPAKLTTEQKHIIDTFCQNDLHVYYSEHNGQVDQEHNIWVININDKLEAKFGGPHEKPHSYKQIISLLTDRGATLDNEIIDKLKQPAAQNYVRLFVITDDENGEKQLHFNTISIEII